MTLGQKLLIACTALVLVGFIVIGAIFFDGVSDFFLEGGGTMFVTLAAGLFGFGVILDRMWNYYITFHIDSHRFLKKVRELIAEDRIDDAVRYCANQKKGLVPGVVRAAIERYGCDENLVRGNVEAAYIQLVPKVTVRLPYLSLIANAAVLFGLVGTVMGMILMFGGLGAVDAATKQAVMASGIAHALHNTFLGLVIALINMIAHGFLSARAAFLVEQIDHAASESMDWVTLKSYGRLHESAAH